jgi:hypothetical protein
MADLTYTAKSTVRRSSADAVGGKGDSHNVKNVVATVETGAAATAGRTYKMARIPSNARISGSSKLYNDDMSTATSALFDIGLGSVKDNITSDPDALNDGLASYTAGAKDVIKDIANIGKPAWSFVNGQSVDPGGELDVYVSITDATAEVGGTFTLDLNYTLD